MVQSYNFMFMVQSYNFMFMVQSYNFMFMVQSYNFLTYYTILVLALWTLKKKQWCKAVGFSIAALSAVDFNRLNECCLLINAFIDLHECIYRFTWMHLPEAPCIILQELKSLLI